MRQWLDVLELNCLDQTDNYAMDRIKSQGQNDCAVGASECEQRPGPHGVSLRSAFHYTDQQRRANPARSDRTGRLWILPT